MVPEERREKILEVLEKKGYASVEELAHILYVSIPTIRRDLVSMSKDHQLRRTHGGAVYIQPGNDILPLTIRNQQNPEAKIKIGKKACTFLQDGQSIFIDSSSTGMNVIKALDENIRLTIITNGVSTAKLLSSYPNVKVELTGGSYDFHHDCLHGWEATQFVERRNVNWFFVSANHFNEKGITSDSNIDIDLKKAMSNHAQKVVLLMDHDKSIGTSLYQVFEWKDIDVFITDQKLDKNMDKVCKENNIEVYSLEK